jgi:hypothetical protein
MAGEIIRRLTADDRPLVEQFRCVILPRRWEEILPELVQLVADGLGTDGLTALGAFEDEDLAGIVAWRPVPGESSTWSVPILGVQLGHQRKGLRPDAEGRDAGRGTHRRDRLHRLEGALRQHSDAEHQHWAGRRAAPRATLGLGRLLLLVHRGSAELRLVTGGLATITYVQMVRASPVSGW